MFSTMSLDLILYIIGFDMLFSVRKKSLSVLLSTILSKLFLLAHLTVSQLVAPLVVFICLNINCII